MVGTMVWLGYQWLGLLTVDATNSWGYQWMGQRLGWGYECLVLHIVGLPMVDATSDWGALRLQMVDATYFIVRVSMVGLPMVGASGVVQ